LSVDELISCKGWRWRAVANLLRHVSTLLEAHSLTVGRATNMVLSYELIIKPKSR